jgi:glycogen debranching enzyme
MEIDRRQFLVMTGAGLLASVGAPALLGAIGDAAGQGKIYDRPEYLAIRRELTKGWGTWDTRDALAQVLLPESLSLSLSFKHPAGPDSFMRPQMVRDKKGSEFRAGTHALDGSYSEADISWNGARLRVQSGTQGDDLVILVTMAKAPDQPVEAIVSAAMLWDRPGLLSRAPGQLVATLPDRVVRVFATGREVDDPYAQAGTPYLSLALEQEIGVSTGRPRTIEQIREIVRNRRGTLEKEAAQHGELAEAFGAIRAAIGWNTIYEPQFGRVITTVSRDWNIGSGGYILFGWDNFFMAYACALFGKELAYANFVEHMRSLTKDGFIPNVEEANGRVSGDRSQPPVGTLVLKELFKRFGDRWLLEASFDDLLAWNRWWAAKRINGTLLSWGSDVASDPYRDANAHTVVAAIWESGMDDSPMYEGVPFNPRKNLLEIQDVGLNGLYIADCRALAEIAETIGRADEARELRSRAEQFSVQIDTLWDRSAGLYLNRRSDTGEVSKRISPTMFYPLVGRVPDAQRAADMVERHLLNPEEFGGQYVLPSIARSDPSFPHQAYWKGAVWPPLNFLVYLGLRNYRLPKARHELAEKSMAMFLHEWRRKGFISENYSALTGTGDDPSLESTPFYTWGVLMGLMGFIEAGQMPAPEAPIAAQAGR